MSFQIEIQRQAQEDIQEAIKWYNKRSPGLGVRFYKEVLEAFSKLKLNPFYQVRYATVRCYALRKFPYMIHFTLDESLKVVSVRAVFHTSQDPLKWDAKE